MRRINNKLKLSVHIRASLAYMITNIISKGISLFTIPIYTRLLSTEEIGTTTVYASWYSILYTIVTLSLSSGSVSVAMVEFSQKRDQYESACLSLSSFFAVGFTMLCAIFNKKIVAVTSLDISVIMVLGVSLLFNPALDFWYVRQRFEYKYISSLIMTCSSVFLSSFISIVCVLLCKYNGWINLGNVKIISQNLTLIVFSFCTYIYIMYKGKCFIDLKMWKYALTLSIPLIGHSIAKSILDTSDRLMIASFCGNSRAGIYGTIYSFSAMALLLWNAINNAIIPTIFEKIKLDDWKGLNKLFTNTLLIFALLSIIATLIAPELLKIFTSEEYYNNANLFPILIGGMFFNALYNIYSNMLLYKKKTLYVMIGTICAAVVNIIANFFCIARFGYIAAAYTTLASFVVLGVVQGVLVEHLYGAHKVDYIILLVISILFCFGLIICSVLYGFVAVRYCVALLFMVAMVIVLKKFNGLSIYRSK